MPAVPLGTFQTNFPLRHLKGIFNAETMQNIRIYNPMHTRAMRQFAPKERCHALPCTLRHSVRVGQPHFYAAIRCFDIDIAQWCGCVEAWRIPGASRRKCACVRFQAGALSSRPDHSCTACYHIVIVYSYRKPLEKGQRAVKSRKESGLVLLPFPPPQHAQNFGC